MPGLVSRLLSRNAAELLFRDAVVSSVTFALGLGLMWMFVDLANMDETIAAGLSFVCANTLHYIGARLWIFRDTARGMSQGYGYFLTNALIGVVLLVLVFAALTEWTPMHYLLARGLSSIAAGVVMFVLNAVFNFKQV